MKKHIVVLMTFLTVFLVLFAGCGGGVNNNAYDKTSYAYSESGGGAMEAPSYSASTAGSGFKEAESYYAEENAGYMSSSVTQGADFGLKIVYTSNLSIQTKEWESSYSRLMELIDMSNGYVQRSNVSGGFTSTSGYYNEYYADLSIRVPSENYKSFLSSVDGIGTITDMNEYTDDITAAYVDTEARINALKLQEQRLLDLLKQSGDLSDLIEIESKLGDVRYQIESYQSIIKIYDNQVSFSTITVYLREVSTIVIPKDTFGQRVVAALKGSANAVVNFFDGFVIALIYLAPFLLIVFIVLLVVLLATKKKRRARKAARTERPVMPSESIYQNPYLQYPQAPTSEQRIPPEN